MIFFDTCSLLNAVKDGLMEDHFVISSITLNELEGIKTSPHKDADIKFAARRTLHYLDEHPDNYTIEIFYNTMLTPFEEMGLDITNDVRILATAFNYRKTVDPELIFVTADLALKEIAKLFFADDILSTVENFDDNYSGYMEIHMTDEDMANFYSNQNTNMFGLEVNQYINIYNEEGELVDTLAWTGETYRRLTYRTFNSKWFGDVKPIKGDIYQAMAADSLLNNKLTMIKGPAGSGKSYLALAYLLHLLDYGKIDKIIVFCNTVATKDSAKLGFYPGTRDEKLLDSQIGNLLASKLGSIDEVQRMIEENQLVLLPLSDIRGFDTTGMNAGIYMSEAQNMSIDLIKLALQRIGEDCICIVDGDYNQQVDDEAFAGGNNGMRRMSQVFRGEDVYGEVELKTVHRSRIAKIAEKL